VRHPKTDPPGTLVIRGIPLSVRELLRQRGAEKTLAISTQARLVLMEWARREREREPPRTGG